MRELRVILGRGGKVRFIHDDDLAAALRAVGVARTARASHVEPMADGTWTADLGPVGGPVLTGFDRRDLALQAETDWLKAHHVPVPVLL